MSKTSITHNKLLIEYQAEKKLLDDYRKEAVDEILNRLMEEIGKIYNKIK